MNPLLQIEDLSIAFDTHGGRVEAVRDVSLEVMPGATVALVGESGSGKSVTAQAVMGILPKNASIGGGRILLNDPDTEQTVDIAALDPDSRQMRAIRGGRVSIIFQEPMVSLSMLHTVGDQVSEALFLHRDVSRSEGFRLTQEMLGMVGFPDPVQALKTYPFELSGGLRQRVMIAIALVCRPSLLIADEPTTALDVTVQAQILHLVRTLQSELGMALLLITHDLGVVANVAQEVVVMYNGEVVERGDINDIYARPEHPYLRALFKAVPHFDMKPGERLTPVRPVEHQLGEHFTARRDSAANHPVQLEVQNVSRSFTIRKESWFKSGQTNTIRAVDDVSFEIMRGECLGLVGESGCGKTTLSKILMRAIEADSGSVRYNNGPEPIDVLRLEGNELLSFRNRMQFIFQDPFSSLSPRMTVFDIVREPLVIHQIGDRESQAELVKELMRLVGLDPRFLSRYPHSFSGGQRQRIGIARALALQPEFLICDEPVSALDVSIQAQVLNLLKDLQKELGLTYLFIS
ncbi:MAG: ABC transporter ATP-binding protein, partial [Pseudomonadota bacterium]|nr:ABC transporter ATP-binding protein [Pseudomonadota bacterium]